MRKRLIDSDVALADAAVSAEWLDLTLTSAEVSSEEPGYPIESALSLEAPSTAGWRAAEPGMQIVRIVFDEPRRISRIHLVFEEHALTRSQEFALMWSPDTGKSFREIVRQQWNFSPEGSTREEEDYRVALENVTLLQLSIVPDIRGTAARASLSSLRIA